jgi:hypothetical protein
MTPAIHNWIFVTGAPRSGTTFVGDILSTPLQVDYIHEPFNPDCGIDGIGQRYLYLRPHGSAAVSYEPLIRSMFSYKFRLRTGYYRNDTVPRKLAKKIVGSRGPFYLRLAKINMFHRAAVVKDPVGCLLAEYLAETFKIRPVILIRHPLAFVASTTRLGWQLDKELSLSSLWEQEELVEDHFSSDQQVRKVNYCDPTAAAAGLWRALNKVLLRQAARHPEWIVIRHEDLCETPVQHFHRLYDKLDLPWSPRIERKVRSRTGGKNKIEASLRRVQTLSRSSANLFQLRANMLSAAQKRMVFEITRDVATTVYSESSFGLDHVK